MTHLWCSVLDTDGSLGCKQGAYVEGTESRFTTYARSSAATTGQLFLDHGLYTFRSYKSLGLSTVDSYYPNGVFLLFFFCAHSCTHRACLFVNQTIRTLYVLLSELLTVVADELLC